MEEGKCYLAPDQGPVGGDRAKNLGGSREGRSCTKRPVKILPGKIILNFQGAMGGWWQQRMYLKRVRASGL